MIPSFLGKPSSSCPLCQEHSARKCWENHKSNCANIQQYTWQCSKGKVLYGTCYPECLGPGIFQIRDLSVIWISIILVF
ncbi:hypothetical protein XENTR_v10002427 [Xenopus tropicalis]|nr:hypothetical protein XENTR_v10002427 [Xenopus tropicalis]